VEFVRFSQINLRSKFIAGIGRCSPGNKSKAKPLIIRVL